MRFAGGRPGYRRLVAHLGATARLCAELAGRQGGSRGRASLAGGLHDWLKPLPPRRLAAILRACGGRLDAEDRKAPALWHGPAAAALARSRTGLRDRAVLEAVRWHTTGHPRLGVLGRALFVADFCEENRGFPEAAVGRRLARRSLGLAVRYVLASKLAYLYGERIAPHPSALAFWKTLHREGANG